jgi:hypothetical protein
MRAFYAIIFVVEQAPERWFRVKKRKVITRNELQIGWLRITTCIQHDAL